MFATACNVFAQAAVTPLLVSQELYMVAFDYLPLLDMASMPYSTC